MYYRTIMYVHIYEHIMLCQNKTIIQSYRVENFVHQFHQLIKLPGTTYVSVRIQFGLFLRFLDYLASHLKVGDQVNKLTTWLSAMNNLVTCYK